MDDEDCGAVGGVKIVRETEIRESCPTATSSTKNPAGHDLGSNPFYRGGKPELW
jgi:hypothetical protein